MGPRNIWVAHFLFHFPSVKVVAAAVVVVVGGGERRWCAALSAPSHLALQQQAIRLCPTIWDSNIKSYLTEIVLKRRPNKKNNPQSRGGPGVWLVARNVDKCNANAERTEGRKMAVMSRANAWLISLGDPNSRGGGGRIKMCNLSLGCSTSKKRGGGLGGVSWLICYHLIRELR